MADMRSSIIFLLLCVLPAFSCADTATFEADEQLQLNARKWAEEFVQFAAERYEEKLDFSHNSIKYLDEMADDLHQSYVTENPSDELIVPVAKALGSYVGEVYRIFNGGKWGWITLEEGSFPGIQAAGGANFLPMEKALDRIKTGNEPDLWEYYGLLSSQ